MWSYSAAGLDVASQHELLERLRELGVRTNPHWKRAKDVDEALAFIDSWKQKRHELDYGTDGVVMKVDRIEDQERLGYVAHNPKWAVAFKFPAEQATTTVEDIKVYVGRTGVLTPVAWLAPVIVGGTTVRRATLHNLDEVRRLDVRVGDRVIIQRAGDVIPEVVRAEHDAREKGKPYSEFAMPERCPECGGIGHFVGRGGFDIEGMGWSLITQLQERGLVTNPADVFFLTKEQLLELDRFAEKSASNIYERIQKARRRPLERMLNALGVPHVGWTTADDLAHWLVGRLPKDPSFGDVLRVLRDTSAEELQQISGIGEVVAKSISEQFQRPEEQRFLERLSEADLRPILPTPRAVAASGPFAGKTVVFTGTLERRSREEAEAIVRSLGGKTTTSVSAKTDLLVAGPGAGTKLEKARQLGVKVVDEGTFDAMLH